MRFLLPLAVAAVFAVLFVGWEVIERRLFTDMTIGWRHALFTLRAAVVTTVACTLVYLLMRRQQRFVSATAERLARLLESYQSSQPTPARFENPNLLRCYEVLDCDHADCPMRDLPGERCWQIRALSRVGVNGIGPRFEIQKCHECDVYRLSCPDKLTELGESFNNLIFLLEEENELARRMRAQMVEKEKMVAVGQIAAGIAHEVGNPLSSISSVVQMLKRSGANSPKSEQLDLLETHIQRISVIVRQLVTLARRGEERWERMDINQAVEQAVRLIRFDRRARNVDVSFEPARALPLTFGLRSHLEQVFINLFLNALDAMPDGGELQVTSEHRHGNILISVQDTGCGIAPETGRRVFEPFFTTKVAGRGTGLGLAVSYGIMQKHGGQIDFRSSPKNGTTFVVQVPIVDKPPDA